MWNNNRCHQKLGNGQRCKRSLNGNRKYCWQHTGRAIRKRSRTRQRAAGNSSLKLPELGKIDVYGKGYCPYTRNALSLIQENPDIEGYNFYDLNEMGISTLDARKFLEQEYDLGEHNTVPMIFDEDNNFIGGFNDLEQIYS